MSISYSWHREATSSCVNPRDEHILPGLIIEYSRKLFNADSVLYLLIGRMPVRYAPAKTLSESCVLNKRRSSMTYSSIIVGVTVSGSPFIFWRLGNSRQMASHSSIINKNFSPVASWIAESTSIRSDWSSYFTSGKTFFISFIIFSCIIRTIFVLNSGLAVNEVTSR